MDDRYRRGMRIRAAVWLAAAALAGGVEAEEGTERSYRMDEIVVTPARTEQRLADVPTNATVISKPEIERSAAITVDDLLRRVPGFSLFRRSSSLVSHPTTQGFTLRGIAPSGVSRSLVLVDGVPLNDPFGGWVYWSRIPRESIERIEIVRGGGSNPWGNYALGGVVHVLTAEPEPRRLSVRTDGGDHGTVDVDAQASDVRGPLGITVGGAFFDTDGYDVVRDDQRGAIDEPADSDHGAFRGKLALELAPGTRAFVRGDWFRERRGNGTALTENATDAGTVAAGLENDADDGGHWRALAFAQLQDFSSTFSAQESDRSSESPALDQFHVPSTAVGTSLEWSHAPLGGHQLGAGGDFRWIDGETNESFFFSEGAFQRRRTAGAEQQLAGAYLQDLIELAPGWRLELGVRGDLWRSLDPFRRERTIATGEELRDERGGDRDEWAASPRAGLVHQATENLRFRAAYYHAFRAPTINELVRPFRVRNDITEANGDLDPERLIGGEAGADWAADRLLARVTGFWNEVKDPVANVTVGAGPGPVEPCGFVPEGGVCRQRQNLGRSRVRGIETELDFAPAPHWDASASYFFSDAEIIDAGDVAELDGKRLAQVPDHQAVFRVDYADPDVVDGSVQVRWVGDQFEDDRNSLELGDFAVVDLFLGRGIGHGIDLFVGIENLFDRTFEAGKSADGIVTIGAPRLVHGGVRLTL
ncbi:MAG: hypothetical protein QOD06_756 [Candidatus Binatota bacterium]|nr:hypothetical protein [Candidatus Binatota bacterium]